MESARDCQKLCQETTHCSKFDYVKDTYDGAQGHSVRKTCVLKGGSSLVLINAESSVVSGPKYCPCKFVATYNICQNRGSELTCLMPIYA